MEGIGLATEAAYSFLGWICCWTADQTSVPSWQLSASRNQTCAMCVTVARASRSLNVPAISGTVLRGGDTRLPYSTRPISPIVRQMTNTANGAKLGHSKNQIRTTGSELGQYHWW